MSDAEAIGELKEMAGTLNVEWQIVSFFSLSEEVDKRRHSPVFNFSEAKWYLRLYANGQTFDASKEYIGIYIIRGCSGPPKSVAYEIFLKTADGKREKMAQNQLTFRNKDIGCGKSKAWLRSNLVERKSELVPSGVLTIVCSLKQDDACVVRSIKEPSEAKEDHDARVQASTQTEAELGIEKLSQDLKGLMLNGDDSDLTIRVKGEEFRLHRNILGARTPVFKSMFKHEMTEKTTGVVSIDDCEADTFRAFLHYVYTGRMDKLSPKNVFALYQVADKYQVDELKADCLECMKNTLSVDTFCDVITLALRHDEKGLLKLATDFFADKMTEIIVTVKWQTFMSENPTSANELLIKTFVNKKGKT